MADLTKKNRTTPIENRNFLSPLGFKFALKRSPSVAFFCNQANIPEMTLGIAEQPTPFKDIPIPGDKIQFGDLQLRFLVDENLENYQEIQKWMRALGFPESLDEIYEWQNKKQDIITPNRNKQLALYSDGTLNVLSNISIPKFRVVFQNMFPVSLSAIEFDAGVQDLEYVTAEVTFKYTIYKIEMIGKGACP